MAAYVADMIDRDDVSWFPIKRSLALAGEADEERDSERIMKTLEYLVNLFKEAEARREEEEKEKKDEAPNQAE